KEFQKMDRQKKKDGFLSWTERLHQLDNCTFLKLLASTRRHRKQEPATSKLDSTPARLKVVRNAFRINSQTTNDNPMPTIYPR
ncbi:hypothetical protein HK098_007973, partial [Nowakowskiella sp. JEL0407]